MDLYGDEAYGMEDFGGVGAYGLDLADENLDPEVLAQNSSK